jgi:hypothetical protein
MLARQIFPYFEGQRSFGYVGLLASNRPEAYKLTDRLAKKLTAWLTLSCGVTGAAADP